MPTRRDIRRLAMQLLYQFDVRGEQDADAIAEGARQEPSLAELVEPAMALARGAWAGHEEADALATDLAPDWPTYRQPPVDRAILRLAHHEIVAGYAPVKVAINEAVELAKHFSTEQSPPFINGVLDKMARRLRQESTCQDGAEPQAPAAEEPQAAAPVEDDMVNE